MLPDGGLATEGGPVPLAVVEGLSCGDGMVPYYSARTIARLCGDLRTVFLLSSVTCTLDLVTLITVLNSFSCRTPLPKPVNSFLGFRMRTLPPMGNSHLLFCSLHGSLAVVTSESSFRAIVCLNVHK